MRGLTLGLLIVTAILSILLLTTSHVSAQTPPVVIAPPDITVEAEGPAGAPATNSTIAAFLESPIAIDESGALLSVVAVGPPKFFPLGSTPVIFVATDSKSNSGSTSATVTVVDTNPPALIVPSDLAVSADSHEGAYVVLPELVATDTVDLAPVVSCEPSSGLFPLGTILVRCSATDASGNRSNASFSLTTVDTNPPFITARVEPPLNDAGWHNTDVTVRFICADYESGLGSCEGDQTLTADGSGQSVRGSATDLEGNITTLIVRGINIDETAPKISITSPGQDAVLLSTDEVLAAWKALDALSGIAFSSGTVASGLPIDTSSQRVGSFTVSATDEAENTATVTHSYSVVMPMALFEIEEGSLELVHGSATDKFELAGRLGPAQASNGIDLPNENVSVTFDGFTATIPAGSFLRNLDDDGIMFMAGPEGITWFQIMDDGRFEVRGNDLDLGSVVTTDPVLFSLRIGDDVAETNITFDAETFELVVRQARDLFGTVASIKVLPDDQGVLSINTMDGLVDVLTVVDTSFKLLHNRNARIDDLVDGDLVAVSMEEKDGVLVADKVFLVPGKTQHQHVPGVIVGLIPGEQITIERSGASGEQIIFDITERTKINLLGRADELTEGLFVVVLSERSRVNSDLSPEALEINVTPGKPTLKSQAANGDTDAAVGDSDGGDQDVEQRNISQITGALELDALGSWTINGIVVAVDPDTKIGEGLVVGQTVKVEGVLREDGTILASRVESEKESDLVSGKAALRGVFQEIDQDTDEWIISGYKVKVGPGTDTDGLPQVGQIVEVEASVQEDGSLLARVIENQRGPTDEEDGLGEIELEGTFLAVDQDGTWNIDGALVLIGPLTRIKGVPTVGQRIEVRALLQEDGSLLAINIEGKGRDTSRPGNQAKVRGTIRAILDNSALVIERAVVYVSAQTGLDFDPTIGDSVVVEASIQADGSLLAREVDLDTGSSTDSLALPSNAEIVGTIQQVNPDGSLVVNGIAVSIGAGAEIRGSLVEGAEVELEGFLHEDSALLAYGLSVRGKQSSIIGIERRVEGRVEDILRNQDNNIVAIIVDGETISAEPLTRFEGLLEVGSLVEVEGLEINGQIVAAKVEVQEDSGRASPGEDRETGRVEEGTSGSESDGASDDDDS